MQLESPPVDAEQGARRCIWLILLRFVESAVPPLLAGAKELPVKFNEKFRDGVGLDSDH